MVKNVPKESISLYVLRIRHIYRRLYTGGCLEEHVPKMLEIIGKDWHRRGVSY